MHRRKKKRKKKQEISTDGSASVDHTDYGPAIEGVRIVHEINETKKERNKNTMKTLLFTYPGIFFVVFQFEK